MRCLTAARHKAVHAHLASLTDRPARPRPGSYAWPELRRTLEQGYAAGARPADVAEAVYTRYATCPAPDGVCVHYHYDVVDTMRTRAINAGAIPIDIRDLGAIITARRTALRATA